jgi:transglutaminase/protease-like cytokinesis protein 3
MRLILTILFLINTIVAFSQNQSSTDYSKVDKFALHTPDSVSTNVANLAAYLTSTNSTPSTEKKLRAIFVWVSQNIRYDDSFDLTSPFGTLETTMTQEPEHLLYTRKGVCMGYAQLFVALAKSAGLKAEVVDGIVKLPDGQIPRMGHSWVAVRLRKKKDDKDKAETSWYLCDPTWSSPSSEKDFGTIKEEYFLAEPEDFIKNHLPLDPMWQLLERPVNVEVFSKESDEKIKKYVSKSAKNPFIFQDTLNRYFKVSYSPKPLPK